MWDIFPRKALNGSPVPSSEALIYSQLFHVHLKKDKKMTEEPQEKTPKNKQNQAAHKTNSLRVRLTPEEQKKAEAASERLFGKKNKSKLIRKLVREYLNLGIDLGEKELAEFREAVRQLTGISRNLNQITTKINKDVNNIKHLHENYINDLKEHVTQVNSTLKNYIEGTIKRFQKKVNHE